MTEKTRVIKDRREAATIIVPPDTAPPGKGENSSGNRWTFSRTVSLDSLLAIGAAAVAVIFFGTTLDKRLSVQEVKYEELKSLVERNENASKERSQRVENTVKEQSDRIERLITTRR